MMNNILMNKKVIDLINETKNYNLELKENEQIIINFYNNNIDNLNIKIVQTNSSSLIINFVSLIKKDTTINIENSIIGNDNKCIIKVHAIAEKGFGQINVKVKANENTKNNKVIEDLKAINEQGIISLMPILEIDTNEIDAEHYATIGQIDKQKLFYLQTKMLNKSSAYKLLREKFIYEIFDNDFLKKINIGKE